MSVLLRWGLYDLSYCNVADGNITAVSSRISLPLEGKCARQMQLPPDGINLKRISFLCECIVSTDRNKFPFEKEWAQ